MYLHLEISLFLHLIQRKNIKRKTLLAINVDPDQTVPVGNRLDQQVKGQSLYWIHILCFVQSEYGQSKKSV